MAKLEIHAVRTGTAVAPDGEAAGIVAADAAGNEVRIWIPTPKIIQVITELLQSLSQSPGFVATADRTTEDPLSTIPARQIGLGWGHQGQALLTMTMGPARLAFHIGGLEQLRTIGRTALEMATVMGREPAPDATRQ